MEPLRSRPEAENSSSSDDQEVPDTQVATFELRCRTIGETTGCGSTSTASKAWASGLACLRRQWHRVVETRGLHVARTARPRKAASRPKGARAPRQEILDKCVQDPQTPPTPRSRRHHLRHPGLCHWAKTSTPTGHRPRKLTFDGGRVPRPSRRPRRAKQLLSRDYSVAGFEMHVARLSGRAPIRVRGSGASISNQRLDLAVRGRGHLDAVIVVPTDAEVRSLCYTPARGSYGSESNPALDGLQDLPSGDLPSRAQNSGRSSSESCVGAGSSGTRRSDTAQPPVNNIREDERGNSSRASARASKAVA